jgi:hypothetical protein
MPLDVRRLQGAELKADAEFGQRPAGLPEVGDKILRKVNNWHSSANYRHSPAGVSGVTF